MKDGVNSAIVILPGHKCAVLQLQVLQSNLFTLVRPGFTLLYTSPSLYLSSHGGI